MNKVSPEFASRLDQIVDKNFGDVRDAGLAAAIVDNGEIVWFTSAGYADLESQRQPDQLTTSRVASITKTFTATAIMRLRDAGMLELEDPLVLHIPEFAATRALAGTVEGVTIKRLLTHHSGLSTEPPLPTWAKPEFPEMDRIIDAISDAEIVIPQDSQWKYSNFGFGLLGEVVHRLTGKNYTDFVESEIIRPLEPGLHHLQRRRSRSPTHGHRLYSSIGTGLKPAKSAIRPFGRAHLCRPAALERA